MSARLALALSLSLGLAACATTAPPPDRLQIVQLSLSAKPEPCDWSGHYEPTNVPDQFSLGATYWPHTMPRSRPWNRKAQGPLTLYGTNTLFLASETSPVICLRLFKRASAFVTGDTARVTAVRLDKSLKHLELGFRTSASVQTVSLEMIGGRFVETSPTAENPTQIAPDNTQIHSLSLDVSSGRKEGRLPRLSFTHSTIMALVATETTSHDAGQQALKTLLSESFLASSEALTAPLHQALDLADRHRLGGEGHDRIGQSTDADDQQHGQLLGPVATGNRRHDLFDRCLNIGSAP
jgi:hypothetical protein